jgi:plasmid stability protein
MKVPLATRLNAGLRQRLRVYAAVTGRTVEDVVGAALDGYLPTTAEMVRDGSELGDLIAEEPYVA